jgi:hypothetical protein
MLEVSGDPVDGSPTELADNSEQLVEEDVGKPCLHGPTERTILYRCQQIVNFSELI